MNRLLPFLAALLVLTLLVACSSDSSGSTTSSPVQRTPTPARTASGASARLEPTSGPPGTRVTVSGTGWAPGAPISLQAASGGPAYASGTTESDGSFVLTFLLEKAPDGSDLSVGRFDLVVASGSERLNLPFLVEVPRPIRPGSGG